MFLKTTIINHRLRIAAMAEEGIKIPARQGRARGRARGRRAGK